MSTQFILSASSSKTCLNPLLTFLFVLILPLLLLFSCGTSAPSPQPVKIYTVTFDSRGGSIFNALQVEEGGDVVKPADPTRIGYDFVGWYKEVALINAFNFDTETITGDITLYAKWEEVVVSTYTVSFDSRGGSIVDALQVEARENVVKPATPTRIGYDFVDWYKEVALINAFNFDTETITGDITLYAKWEEVVISTYTVIFDSTEGSAVDALQVEEGGDVVKPADPTRTGYTFVGWYKEDTYTTLFKFTGEAEADTVTEAITLYAKWEEVVVSTYTVSFDSRGGSIVDALQVEAEKNVVKPATPTRIGYDFVGWYKEVALINAFNFDTETITGDITLYAKWEEVVVSTYTVIFDSTEGSAVDALQVETGENVVKPAAPTRTGYDFVGWYKEVALINAFNFDTETITGDITLYAKWEEVVVSTYTVIFDSTEGSAVDALQVETGENVVKPAAPTRTGYDFVGWYKEVALINAFNFDTETITGDITLYAKWEEVVVSTYTVTFDSGAGSAVDALQVEAGENVVKPANPTRTGYDFVGWYKEVALINAFNFDTETITGDITLYAKWEEVVVSTYTVTFDSGAGSAVDALQVEAEKNVVKPANPTRAGYDFVGWYKEDTYTTLFKFTGEAEADTVTEAITLYAKWEEAVVPTYTVTFDSTEGSAVVALQVEAGKNVVKPADPTRAGYDFVGWYREDTYTTLFKFTGEAEADTITEAIRLYAKWEEAVVPTYTVTFDSTEGSAVVALQVEVGENVVKPADPTRTGYDFVGWYKEDTYTTLFKFTGEAEADAVTEAITLYAKWEEAVVPTYTVTFDSTEGSAVVALQVEVGENVVKPTDPTRSGYTFAGWYKEIALTTIFNFETETITEDTTLYANWEVVVSYTVTFDSQGGSTVDVLQVEAEKKATKPTNPTRSGHTFAGWYKETDLNVFNFETETITEDITLYANWEVVVSYTVTFDSTEGSAIDALQVEAEKKATKPTDPTRTGYTFAGWYKEIALTTIFNFETETITEDITLYAKWEERKVSVIFKRIGDRGPEEPLGEQHVVEGQSLSSILFEKPPYVLIDLYRDEQGMQVFDQSTVIEASQTLYVRWLARPKNKEELIQLIDTELEKEGNKADLNFIDTHLIIDMSRLFENKVSFNGDISDWNVAAVTDMNQMFHSASAFNGDISGWNVATVRDMGYMFSGAIAFNGDISGWNVAAVTDMGYMFYYASVFNGDISGWNVAAVTDMRYMFNFASAFNGNISAWNVATVRDMRSMFYYASAFNRDISGWNVAAVRNMTNMFSSASAFNGDIGDWNVATVRYMSFMFYYASAFNQDLEDWDVVIPNLVNRNGVFKGSGLSEDAQPSWYRPKLSFVTGVEGISIPPIYQLAGERVKNVPSLDPVREGYVFQYWSASEGGEEAFDFNQGITTDIILYAKWKPVQTLVVTFQRIGDRGPKEFLGEQYVIKDQSLSLTLFEKSPYVLIDLYRDEQGMQVFDQSTVIEASQTLYVRWLARPKNKEELIQLIDNELKKEGNKADLNFIDTQLIVNMSALFQNKYEFNGDISGWNVAAVKSMFAMFSSARAFNGDISGWNVATVRDMRYMFYYASAFNQNLDSWNVVSTVDKVEMFTNSGMDSLPNWY